MATRTNISVEDFLKAVFEAKAAEDAEKLVIEVVTDELVMGEDGLPELDEEGNEQYVVENRECTAIEFIAHNTGLNEKTVEQKLTKFRNPEFEYEEYLEDGKPVYKTGELDEDGNYLRNEDNTVKTTTDPDLARLDKDGNLVRAERKKLDSDGNPVILRPALPIPTFKRGGGGRTGLADQVDEAMALIARLSGKSIAELQAEQAEANAKAIKRATAG